MSDAYEELGGEAIRIGRAWGQELRSPEARWYLRSLLQICKPDDVLVAFPCTLHCQWSSYNEHRGLATRRKVLQDRLESKQDLHLLFEVIEAQTAGGRHVHAENPQGSRAWKDARFQTLKCTHHYVDFHQCVLGLKSPKTGAPIRKATRLFTTRQGLVNRLQKFRCCHASHARLEGSFQGKPLTKWAENYPMPMARQLARGMISSQVRYGHIGVEEEYEPPHFEEQLGLAQAKPCWVCDGVIAESALAGSEAQASESQVSQTNTIFKVQDPELSQQLNKLQFPGRYKQTDLPVPIQTQLSTWSGLQTDTVVTARGLKCYVNLPVGVVATKRTTLARVSGEWFYVDYRKDVDPKGRRLRLPVNCTLLVTFFGDHVPDSQPPAPAQIQPKVQPLPGLVKDAAHYKQVYDYLHRLHVGLGHCGQAEFIQHLRDAGAAPWLVEQAKRFQCPVCEAQKPPAPRPIVGTLKPRSFNSVLAIDTLDLTLERDHIQYRVLLLTAIDSATSYARAFLLPAGDAATAVSSLERGWFDAYGAPEVIFADPDTIFRSEVFAQFLARNAVVERLTAAQSPHQHGQVERLHRTLRQQVQRVFEADRACEPYQAVCEVLRARNELMRVEGVSPAVLVFGKLPKGPPSFVEGSEDYEMLAERLHLEDPLYETLMLRRIAARTAWVQSEVRDRTSRMQASRPRPYKGPYAKGQIVLVYRRRKGDASSPGRRGVWLGPGEVVAVESTSDKLVPRVVYVTVHGRLFLSSPEQLRPVSLQAEWLRGKWKEEGIAQQKTFQEMKVARGIDVRNERPTSQELESAYEREEPLPEELLPEAEYEPAPQAPPTPVPGTPTPGTPKVAVARSVISDPPETRPVDRLVPNVAVPTEMPTPPGGDPVTSSASVGSDVKRGGKRPVEEHQGVEEQARDRAIAGPSQQTGETRDGLPSTVVTGAEGVRGARGRSRTPPPREGSFLSIADFEGAPSDHVSEAWFSQSCEHDYSGSSIGLEFDVELSEIQSEQSIVHVIREMCYSAAAMKKRNAEVKERFLDSHEKAMFRTAKMAEWSQWVNNDVVDLISRHGIDPKRIISSRWVLTWKAVDSPASKETHKAKARLVIRGFRDPDLGQFSTASPTLSRQGRHAILSIAAQNQWRLFTLDAKTAFLAGDKSSRVKPIYAELPKDLVRDHGYSEDTIARIKKVPYGLSEAPLAWYKRLTQELLSCGFEQVPADRCIYVLRDPKGPSRILGIVGAHVDDLLIAGCTEGTNPYFEEALRRLTTKLPFGDRKYADVYPVIYTGINLRQNKQTREIVVDQLHYIEKLTEVPLRPLQDGLLDKSGQAKYWSRLGALLWVAINTRPDVAYDVSHYASFGTRPEKQHLSALNKIVRTLKARECTITFSKIAPSWEDLTLVVFTDAGHASRPSGHSQSGTMIFWAPRTVLDGQEVQGLMADFGSSKIDRAVWSSYASELQAATISSDAAVSVLLLYEQILYGMRARDVKRKITDGSQPRVLVTDNKGLYDAIQVEKPSTRQGVKMQSLVYQILFDLVTDHSFKTYWVNGAHMIADGLTKLSSSGGNVELIRQVLDTSRIRITYCITSGRKEKKELRQLHPSVPSGKELESSLDV